MRARENPFRVDCLHELRFRFLAESLPDLLHKLELQNFTGALIGPHGTGKSTLLAHLMRCLRQQGREVRSLLLTEANRVRHLREVDTWLAAAQTWEILVLDGAEQLDRRTWRRVVQAARKTSGLIVTAHQPGLLPTLYECSSTAELLSDLVNELLQVHPQWQVSAEVLQALCKQHRGNLRECLRELYDQFSELH